MVKKLVAHKRQLINGLRRIGYTCRYDVRNGLLVDINDGTKYSAADVHVVGEHEYRQNFTSKPASTLYVLHTKDGKKGTCFLNNSDTTKQALGLIEETNVKIG